MVGKYTVKNITTKLFAFNFKKELQRLYPIKKNLDTYVVSYGWQIYSKKHYHQTILSFYFKSFPLLAPTLTH